MRREYLNKMKKEKLPQNILTILQDIGENSVLFHLYLLTKGTDWTVYKNLGDKGCDLILQRETPSRKDNNKIRIEVKTRQKYYTTSKKKNADRQAQFFLSKNEYDSCDFLVAFWFDKNAYFIVPKTELKPAGTKNRYRFIVRQNKDGQFSGTPGTYQDKWKLIKEKIK